MNIEVSKSDGIIHCTTATGGASFLLNNWMLVCTTLCAPILSAGCTDLSSWHRRGVATESAPLGVLSDNVWEQQEEAGEASEFVIYAHEFALRSEDLNTDGQDHVKQLANRLRNCDMTVVIERSMNGNQNGQYKYPVNPDPELDNRRRDLVVAVLNHLGIADAEERVVVAPAFATSANSDEAEAAFYQSFGGSIGSASNSGFGGFGGYGGLGGGFGGGGVGGISGSGGSGSGGFGGSIGSVNSIGSTSANASTSPQ